MTRALGLVLGEGNTDLVRTLGLAGIPVAVAGARLEPSRFSRFVERRVTGPEAWRHPDELVERLLDLADSLDEPPVLVYQGDGNTLLVSRYRDELSGHFRFVIPEARLVEDLLDKAAFQDLAERLSLPVPRAAQVGPHGTVPDDLDFPLLVKPISRETMDWDPVGKGAKAMIVHTPDDLREVWPSLAATGADYLAQEFVPGPESRIESYHAYIDETGSPVGEFTGIKIRTNPPRFGHSTAVTITDSPDVLTVGRKVVETLGFRGVVKLDFKRDAAESLVLLEVNAKFTLWHLPGALAGVNIPALVYADLTGAERPPVAAIRPGISWCKPWADLPAARAEGMPVRKWVRWAARCEAKRNLAWDDPLPAVAMLVKGLQQLLT